MGDDEPDWMNQPATEERSPPPNAYDSDEVEAMFDTAFGNAESDGAINFLESVYEWWQTKGFITEKQYEAVKKYT